MPLGTLSYDDPTLNDPTNPKAPNAPTSAVPGTSPSLTNLTPSVPTTPSAPTSGVAAGGLGAYSFAGQPPDGSATSSQPHDDHAPLPGPDPWSNVTSINPGSPDVQQPTSSGATPPTTIGAAGGAPPPAPSGPSTDYTSLMQQVQSATDPQQRAILQDQLARNVYSTLQAAGHDVKWDGDNLVVDGRPYVIGGGMAATGATASATASASDAGAPAPGGVGQPSYASASASAPPVIYHPDPGGIFGFDTSKLQDPNKSDAKYTPAAKAFSGALAAGVQISRGGLDSMVQYLQQHGFTNAAVAGEDKIDFGDGAGPIDVLADQGGKDLVTFQNTGGPGQPGGGPAGPSGGGGTPFDIPGSGAPDPGSIPTGNIPGPADPGWSPTAPTYTPGTITSNDIPDLTVDGMLGKMPVTTPGALDANYAAGSVNNDPIGAYSFGGFNGLGDLGPGQTNAQTEELVSKILANPESYPPEVVDMLKAKSKDELAQMAQSDTDNLTAAGYKTGNADSNWLQSEKLAAAGRRDQALVASNRSIDLTAATQNSADRRSAAQLGQGFAESQDMMKRADDAQRLSEQQAAEGDKQAAADSAAKAAEFRRQGEQINEQLRQTAFDERTKVAQQNIENAFTSDKEKQSALQLATDASLKAASLRGDRMALEEQIKQKATELGQSADTIRQNYVLGLLHDATTKYGIDVGASIDRAKLAQAGTQFQQDLAFRIMQLEQQDQQFGAQYGLDFAKTQHQIDQDMYNRSVGAGG